MTTKVGSIALPTPSAVACKAVDHIKARWTKGHWFQWRRYDSKKNRHVGPEYCLAGALRAVLLEQIAGEKVYQDLLQHRSNALVSKPVHEVLGDSLGKALFATGEITDYYYYNEPPEITGKRMALAKRVGQLEQRLYRLLAEACYDVAATHDLPIWRTGRGIRRSKSGVLKEAAVGVITGFNDASGVSHEHVVEAIQLACDRAIQADALKADA